MGRDSPGTGSHQDGVVKQPASQLGECLQLKEGVFHLLHIATGLAGDVEKAPVVDDSYIDLIHLPIWRKRPKNGSRSAICWPMNAASSGAVWRDSRPRRLACCPCAWRYVRTSTVVCNGSDAWSSGWR